MLTLLNASYNVYGRTDFENIAFAKKHVTDEPTVYLQKHNFKRCTTACDTPVSASATQRGISCVC